MISPELQAKIAQWRERARTGELTRDELREAVRLMREGRMAASAASSRAKAKAAVPDADELMKELEGL